MGHSEKVEHDLFSLPVRLGGLQLSLLSPLLNNACACSQHIANHSPWLVSQVHDMASCFIDRVQLCPRYTPLNKKIYRILPTVFMIKFPLSSVELACEKRASHWLSCLPLKFHDFPFQDGVMPHHIISLSHLLCLWSLFLH